MRTFTERDLGSELDEGFRLVPLPPPTETASAPLGPQIHVVVRAQADPAAGHFVLLRATPLARVFLGCLADSSNRPLDWLELWVQNTDLAVDSTPGFREHLTNAAWDARWRDLAASLRAGETDSLLATPLETGHLPPAVLDAAAGRFLPLTDFARGQRLRLCVDDALLADASLPGYAASIDRYLYTPGVDPAEATFVRLRRDAPGGSRTVDLDATEPAPSPDRTLGLGGGGVIVRRFAPLGLADFSDVAGGRPWKGLDNARKVFRVPGVYRLLEDEDAMRYGSAHLFSAAQGRAGKLAEALYLKLQMLSQALRLVRGHVRQTQLPCLNLATDSPSGCGWGRRGSGCRSCGPGRRSWCGPAGRSRCRCGTRRCVIFRGSSR